MVQTLVSTANDPLDNSILFPEMLIFAGDIPLVSWSSPDAWLKSPNNPAKFPSPMIIHSDIQHYSTPLIFLSQQTVETPKKRGNSQGKKPMAFVATGLRTTAEFRRWNDCRTSRWGM